MEWILAPVDEQETTATDFSDLVKRRFDGRVKGVQLNPIAAWQARQTGFAGVNLEKEMESLDVTSAQTMANIEKMKNLYGSEKLNAMTSSEFYKLYKHHNTGTNL